MKLEFIDGNISCVPSKELMIVLINQINDLVQVVNVLSSQQSLVVGENERLKRVLYSLDKGTTLDYESWVKVYIQH